MENKLVHLVDFHRALANYHVSERAQKILDQTKLILLTAPSAGGRNTIINELLKTGNYHFIISDTTRRPRANDGVMEQDGHEYWFRSEEKVLQDIKDGEFLEAEILHGQQVSGISIRELEKAQINGKIAITDVDIGGINNVLKAKPDTFAIVVLPPSFEEWQRRLTSRGQMPADEYKRRVETAAKIFQQAQTGKYKFVINDTITDAVQQVNNIVSGKIDTSIQTKAKGLVKELEQQTKKALQASS